MPIAFAVPHKQRDRYMPMCADAARDPGDEQELTLKEIGEAIITLYYNTVPRVRRVLGGSPTEPHDFTPAGKVMYGGVDATILSDPGDEDERTRNCTYYGDYLSTHGRPWIP